MVGLGLALGGAQALMGGIQWAIGKNKEKKNKRPTYSIPPEIAQNLTQAQQQALQGLPEEQKQQYLSNLERGASYGLGQLSSRKAGLAGVAAINQQQNDAYGNLLAQDSAVRMQNQQQLMGAKQTMADYRDQAFQINQSNPYYEKQAQAQALKGAGLQNLGGGLNMAAGGLLSGLGGKKKMSLGLNDYYNPQKPVSGSMINDNPYQYQNIG